MTNKFHYVFISGIIIPNLIFAWIFNDSYYSLFIAYWLIIPCNDRVFGNGKKFYHIRQLIFAIGSIVALIISNL